MFKVTLENQRKIKYILAFLAIVIVVISVYFSSKLANDMAEEEQKRIGLWAEATLQLTTDENTDLVFILRVIQENNTIPGIIATEDGEVLMYRNVKHVPEDNTKDEYLQKKLKQFGKVHNPIPFVLDEDTNLYLYYDDSDLQKRLAYYPYIQWSVITVFFGILFFVFTSAKKSEQDRVWVGLSRETAHQLGTPISSLLAWVEILKTKGVEIELLPEMEKDVNRLRTIAERFSKIGSKPDMEKVCFNDVLDNALSYMRKRTSNKVRISCVYEKQRPMYICLNTPLFEWVIENLSKNAIDAMDGEGAINILVADTEDKIYVDIQDTGKGIPKSKQKTVFNPGYTTKKRGWGLGLSLVKRIIEEYHEGKIFVKRSEVNKGTTFRIILNKNLKCKEEENKRRKKNYN
jgi:signal transduction histidine kinase